MLYAHTPGSPGIHTSERAGLTGARERRKENIPQTGKQDGAAEMLGPPQVSATDRPPSYRAKPAASREQRDAGGSSASDGPGRFGPYETADDDVTRADITIRHRAETSQTTSRRGSWTAATKKSLHAPFAPSPSPRAIVRKRPSLSLGPNRGSCQPSIITWASVAMSGRERLATPRS